jgi:hypothetical protein
VGNGQHSHPQVIDVFRSQTSSLPYVIMWAKGTNNLNTPQFKNTWVV